MILAIKTDQPEAYIALINGGEVVSDDSWEAHKQLSDTLLARIEGLLERQNLSVADVSGIIVFKGPGSFTGLRIGATVGNTLAYANDVPISGTNGDSWIKNGLEQLVANPENRVIKIEYGGEANITTPRK